MREITADARCVNDQPSTPRQSCNDQCILFGRRVQAACHRCSRSERIYSRQLVSTHSGIAFQRARVEQGLDNAWSNALAEPT